MPREESHRDHHQPHRRDQVEKGFSGGECRDASRFVETALGQRTAEQLKGEFYQSEPVQRDLRQSN
ncbi:MAG: DUF2997 domain-containing protein [Singulisphaera sp.]